MAKEKLSHVWDEKPISGVSFEVVSLKNERFTKNFKIEVIVVINGKKHLREIDVDRKSENKS